MAEPHSVRLHLPPALKDYRMRRTIAAVDAILRAAEILDELHPACLETVRDYCQEINSGRNGAESDRAWIAMVCEHLNDAKLRERRLFYGLTGNNEEEDEGKEEESKKSAL
jgi:hypothetical protein